MLDKLKQARKIMVTIILLAITARVILWAIGPLIPYMVGGLILLGALGHPYYWSIGAKRAILWTGFGGLELWQTAF